MASNLKKGSVTTKSIKKGAVTTKKLAKGAVGTKKIKNGAVTNAKIANGTIGLSKLSEEAINALEGARGPKGDTGAQGPQGPAGLLEGYEIFTEASSVAPGSWHVLGVWCPEGKAAVGGGYSTNANQVTARSSRPTFHQANKQGQWLIDVRNDHTSAVTVTVHAACASIG